MSQEVKTVFEYNGASYEIDIRDADQSEKFENALALMDKEEKEIPKTGKASEIIRAQCKMLKAFFDRVFGEGAGDAICTEKSNISVCYAAYDAFLKLLMQQKADILQSKNVFAKYSNRAQRRAEVRAKK